MKILSDALKALSIENMTARNNALIELTNNGVKISRTGNNYSPACTINQGATIYESNILHLQYGGNDKLVVDSRGCMYNNTEIACFYLSTLGSLIDLIELEAGSIYALQLVGVSDDLMLRGRIILPKNNDAATILRDWEDALPALVVDQHNTGSTGDIARFQFNGTTKARFDKDGNLTAPNVLTTNNTTAFTPDSDYEPATKKYVDDNANPPGAILIWSTNTAPSGYLLCDGSSVSRTTYANLFAVIGTTYGSGDGSSTFNLPDLKGKFPVGRDSAQTEFDTLAETGGEKAHTLTTTEMPSHTHQIRVYDGGDSSNDGSPNGNYIARVWDSGARVVQQGYRTTYTADSYLNGVLEAGADEAHNNLQPYIVMNYIIKY